MAAQVEQSLHPYEDTYALRKRATATFSSSKGHNTKSFSRIDVEEEDSNEMFKGSLSEVTANPAPSIDTAKKPRPPLDKVMVREDICVEYSDV